MVNSNFSLSSKAPATTSLLSLIRIPQSYKTVWEVDSVEEFKHAFIDLFKRHYFAYKQGVLRYQPSEVVKALKLSDLAPECRVSEPLAILNDLDHGQHVDYVNDIDCSTDVPLNFPPNNTFAASDCILVEERCERVEIPQYRYRYDLEGFLYVLIWVVNHCEPGSKRKRLTQRDLASWETCYDIDKHQRTKLAIRYYFDDEYGVESFQQLGQDKDELIWKRNGHVADVGDEE
ncbi:hypothetical protein ONZ45_g10760 [Pleurotus djamor]|nr:hypothetical protein ONZ45_g10760 [Pleurotus djamor]